MDVVLAYNTGVFFPAPFRGKTLDGYKLNTKTANQILIAEGLSTAKILLKELNYKKNTF